MPSAQLPASTHSRQGHAGAGAGVQRAPQAAPGLNAQDTDEGLAAPASTLDCSQHLSKRSAHAGRSGLDLASDPLGADNSDGTDSMHAADSVSNEAEGGSDDADDGGIGASLLTSGFDSAASGSGGGGGGGVEEAVGDDRGAGRYARMGIVPQVLFWEGQRSSAGGAHGSASLPAGSLKRARAPDTAGYEADVVEEHAHDAPAPAPAPAAGYGLADEEDAAEPGWRAYDHHHHQQGQERHHGSSSADADAAWCSEHGAPQYPAHTLVSLRPGKGQGGGAGRGGGHNHTASSRVYATHTSLVRVCSQTLLLIHHRAGPHAPPLYVPMGCCVCWPAVL